MDILHIFMHFIHYSKTHFQQQLSHVVHSCYFIKLEIEHKHIQRNFPPPIYRLFSVNLCSYYICLDRKIWVSITSKRACRAL